jgi:hypothetical protein
MKRQYYIQYPGHNGWEYWGNVIVGQGYDSKLQAEQAQQSYFKNHISIKPEMTRIVYIDYFEEAAE